MRLLLPGLFSVFLVFSIAGKAQTPDPIPPPPTDFDSKAKTPPDLPKTLEIPKNMRIEVSVWPKVPFHFVTPPNPDNLDIKMDPALEGAVIERGTEDVHATFNWQGNRTSEAFIIQGFCFRKVSFVYPNMVVGSDNSMTFWLNRGVYIEGASYNFPGVLWYAPSTFAGNALMNGTKVLVFAQNGIKPGTDTYPEANSVCLDPHTFFPLYMDDGGRVFTFTYIPDPNVQINPQGPYLQAIQKQFGHYP